MQMGFGKHASKSHEWMLVRQPDYVKWVLDEEGPSGRLADAQRQFRRLISQFNASPFLEKCFAVGCLEPLSDQAPAQAGPPGNLSLFDD
jgi:hypothetical protein